MLISFTPRPIFHYCLRLSFFSTIFVDNLA